MRRRVRLVRTIVLVLLVGAGVVLARPDGGTAVLAANVGPQVSLPAAPVAWRGGDAGCVVADPTGTGGCVAPVTAHLVAELRPAVGNLPITCWSEHAWNPASDHPRGLGCDVFPGPAGHRAHGADLEAGWTVAQWLREHADALGVSYVIWQGRIWTHDRAAEGWRPYDGGGVYDAQDPTGGHFDHVHVSLRG